MNNQKTGRLKSALNKKYGITIYRLSTICTLGKTTLLDINRDSEMNVGQETIQEIFRATKKEYGTGLMPKDYLSKSKYTILKEL